MLEMENTPDAKYGDAKYVDSPIRRVREEHNLSQNQLAVDAGVGLSTIQSLEKGVTEATILRCIAQVARALGVKLHVVFDDEIVFEHLP
jgi:DNA-binding XRE family transcriptional regulator